MRLAEPWRASINRKPPPNQAVTPESEIPWSQRPQHPKVCLKAAKPQKHADAGFQVLPSHPQDSPSPDPHRAGWKTPSNKIGSWIRGVKRIGPNGPP